jgi:hypothetical protein
MLKKEIIEFENIVTDLYAISESPCFNDEMRTKASNLQYYINKYKVEPFKVGDWVKVETKSFGFFFAKIIEFDNIDNEKVVLFFGLSSWYDFDKLTLTKLSNEQIKSLNLEQAK